MATTSNPAPTTLTALQPAWGAVAREAVAEAGESATENAARRAVAAVTAVMDANAESRLKSAPSVSLRFKVGHEDLAVRIEMRGGQVRTEFRTDSAELQAAVAQEWRALAASPESLLRNQEPVFVGSNNSSSSGQGGSSLAQQQQQQGQSSAQSQARESQDHFGRIVRRVPVALAAADSPLTPLTLHSANSHRLSAVA